MQCICSDIVRLTNHQFIDSSPVNLRPSLVHKCHPQPPLNPLLQEEHPSGLRGVAMVNCSWDILPRRVEFAYLEVGQDVHLSIGVRRSVSECGVCVCVCVCGVCCVFV